MSKIKSSSRFPSEPQFPYMLEKFEEIKTQLELKDADLMEMLKVSQSTANRLLNKQTHITYADFYTLCMKTGVPLDWAVGGTNRDSLKEALAKGADEASKASSFVADITEAKEDASMLSSSIAVGLLEEILKGEDVVKLLSPHAKAGAIGEAIQCVLLSHRHSLSLQGQLEEALAEIKKITKHEAQIVDRLITELQKRDEPQQEQ